MSDDAPRVRLTRRRWLVGGAAVGGGLLALRFAWSTSAPAPTEPDPEPTEAMPPLPGELAAWVRIARDGAVTVIVPKVEMGQGIVTTACALVAEEMGAAMSQVTPELAPAAEVYADALFERQSTVGSTSIETLYTPLREVGARVRALLEAAAAERWSIDVARCEARDGHVHDGERSLGFGELAEAAASVPVPERVPLRPLGEHRLLGRSQPRLDTREKVLGRTVYSSDVTLPGMLVAQLVQAPSVGSTLGALDPAPALAVPGVRAVEVFEAPYPTVAVVAESFWAAKRGRRALEVPWDEPMADVDDAALAAELEGFDELVPVPLEGLAAPEATTASLAEAPQRLRRVYQSGYFAHLPMEPPCAVAWVHDGCCEVWGPIQRVTFAVRLVAREAGVPKEAVDYHPVYVGGSFGQGQKPTVVRQAVALSRRLDAPVKVRWTREDDVRHDHYHPAAHLTVEAGWDDEGLRAFTTELRCLHVTAVGYNGVDGALAYTPQVSATQRPRDGSRRARFVPTGALRGVGSIHTGFARESLLDEIAAERGVDPLAQRVAWMRDARGRALLERARGVWDEPKPEGVGHGVAFHRYKGHVSSPHWTRVVVVAEVHANEGRPRPRRLAFFVDCGRVLDPRNAEAQVVGGALYGLSTFFANEIHFDGGRVRESGFHDYPPLRIDEAPRVEVTFVDSDEHPTGVGEIGTTILAPALASAIADLTGGRPRRLPLAPQAR